MKWSGRANKELVSAIVDSFCDRAVFSRARLSKASYQEWAKTYYWLDASGMALYFLDLLQRECLEDAVPERVLARLRGNAEDNRARSALLIDEFVSINHAFIRAGVQYCNLKGFTLYPDSCPDPNLRCQLDLDFLVDSSELEVCATVLGDIGYSLSWAKEDVWEFKAGGPELVRIENHYKSRPQRSVELHFAPLDSSCTSQNRQDCLTRSHERWIAGIRVPALSPADQFIGQALHVLGHLRSPCTRLAWLLEFKRNVATHQDNAAHWNSVRERSEACPNSPIAVGVVTALSLALFGGNTPEGLVWAVECLPEPVKLWVDHYGRRAVLADFPGTKLHLLLESALPRDGNPLQRRRMMFVPQLRAARIAIVKQTDPWPVRVTAGWNQARYNLFRVRFHLLQSFHYLMELPRWRRRLRYRATF